MTLRTTLAVAVATTAIALPVSLLTAAAAPADQGGTTVPGAVCHTIDVDSGGAIKAQRSCTTGPLIVAGPHTKAIPPRGYRS